MSEKNKFQLSVYPPPEPLKFPLETRGVTEVLGISKSTLFRYDQYIQPDRDLNGVRQYTPEHLRMAMSHMQGVRHVNGHPYYKWLDGIDLNSEVEVSTPSKHQIKIEPREKFSNRE